jgi:hypothetical protein
LEFFPRETKATGEISMASKLTLVTPAPNAAAMPEGLDADGEGSKLWGAIMAEYVIDDCASLEVLKQCCFAADMAARCRKQLDESGLILHGKAGARENPMIRHELNYRSFITRSLQRLGLLSEPLRPGPGRPPTYGGI